jgi:flavin reductase (DIM6/NTAB) family NADH-FMN oxidoreductase RutF
MTERIEIAPLELNLPVYSTWKESWFLLTAGDYTSRQFNSMTVAWGGLGAMWDRSFAMVAVRPSRYTYEFMERYPTFTLCRFPEGNRKALLFCGSKSGREIDKIKLSGLTPIASTKISAPGFAEAELIIECKKIYSDDYKPERFLAEDIEKSYRSKNYHRIYFGAIETIWGTAGFKGSPPID